MYSLRPKKSDVFLLSDIVFDPKYSCCMKRNLTRIGWAKAAEEKA